MPYRPLQLASDTPAVVRAFIQESVENLCFKDVHTMLKLPQPSMGLEAGLNFAIAHSLLAAIGGISATLYASEGEPGELFFGVLRDYYPWTRESQPALKAEAGAGYLYDVFRNPLTHSLGLFTERICNSRRRYVAARKYAVKIGRLTRGGSGLGEPEVEALEDYEIRPTMPATLTVVPDRVLLLEGLYWGSRCMVEALTHDKEKMRQAETFLSCSGDTMNNANQPFFDAVKRYPAFKALFKDFCDEATKRLNGNAYLSDVNFSAGVDGASAQLQALDRTFEISLRFLIVENAPWGVLQVSLPEESKELFHLFFDERGNVKATPEASADLHPLFSTGFVEAFVNRVAHEYFSHLSAVLK